VDGCRRVCQDVGDELRKLGFLGVFGLDLIVSERSEGVVIETNARLQSVTSLLNAAEIVSGVLPSPGTQVLSFLHPRLPEPILVDDGVRPLSQVVLYACRSGVLESVIATGRYRLDGLVLAPVEGDPVVTALGNDEVLLWKMASPGDLVTATDRIAVLQFSHRVAPIEPGWDVDEDLVSWVEAVRRGFRFRM
jgi:hypothetical protein